LEPILSTDVADVTEKADKFLGLKKSESGDPSFVINLNPSSRADWVFKDIFCKKKSGQNI